MKKTLTALTAIAAMSFGSIALAGPTMMSDAQMNNIVAGAEHSRKFFYGEGININEL